MEEKILNKVHKLSKEIKESKANHHKITQILEYVDVKYDNSVILAALKCLQNILGKFYDKGELGGDERPVKRQKFETEEKVEANSLAKHLGVFVDSLQNLLVHPDYEIQYPSLMTLIFLEKKSAENQIDVEGNKDPHITNKFLQTAIQTLIRSESNQRLLDAFVNELVLKFHDITFFTLVGLKSIIQSDIPSLESTDPTLELLASNVLHILKAVTLPVPDKQSKAVEWNFLVPPLKKQQRNPEHPKKRARSQEGQHRVNKIANYRKAFQEVWMSYLNINLTPDLFLTALSCIQMMIPNFSTPCVLLNFLTESYNFSEKALANPKTRNIYFDQEISLIALHGIFTLMVDHNLDYPDFFPKAYRLMRPSIVHSDQILGFLQLLDSFLKSPLIPSYMIVAFAKRLARLALLAPPTAANVMLAIIYNLMISHHDLRNLIHYNRSETESAGGLQLNKVLSSDPFKFEELDIKKCNANQSSLWEVLALQHHYVPQVVSTAKMFKNHISVKNMFFLKDLVQANYQTMIENELKKKAKAGIPLAYEEPQGLFPDFDYTDSGWF